MAQQNADEIAFTPEELEKTIQDTIDQFLVGKVYNEKMVAKWINDILEDLIKKLTQAQKPYKYMANCLIMQRNGAMTSFANSTYWDTAGDLSSTVVWPKDKQSKTEQNKATIQCMVTVYALSLNSSA